MTDDSTSRRTFLRATGTATAVAAAGALAGCSDNGDSNGGLDADATVAVGPNGDFVFDPDQVTIQTGETVGWTFETASHNVSAKPDASDEVSIPEGAEGFASYDGDNHLETNEEGDTFTHTFETAGEYTYVCVPHVSADMIGTVVVE